MITIMHGGRIIAGRLRSLDQIVRRAVPALVNRWDGDEAGVASVVEIPRGFGVAWVVRDTIVAELHRRGQIEQAATYKERYRLATMTLQLPRPTGKVTCIIDGWGNVLVIELDAQELRWGLRYTAPGGSA
jgi:hypothetical protein